jgi:hypothetical protein
VSPEPEELVTPPKPEVLYSPLAGVTVQSALAADEVDVEVVGVGVMVEVGDSMRVVEVVGAMVEVEVVHSMEEDQDDVEVVKTSKNGVGEGIARTLEDELSQGQAMIVESVVTVTVLSASAWRRAWPSWRP